MPKHFPIVCVGDTHFPFSHRPTEEQIISLIDDVRPKFVVQIGDLYDFPAFSRFPKRLSMSPEEELSVGRAMAEEFWDRIRRVAPRAKLIQLKGNHDARPRKRILEVLPEIISLVDLDSLWKFPYVETLFDEREDFVLGDVVFQHGHYVKLGDHLRANDFKNSVHGHTHRGGVFFYRLANGNVRWELDCGYLGDPFSEHLIYRPSKRFFAWTHGMGLIDEQGPRFIPLGT